MIIISYLCINDLNEYELQISDYRGFAHSSPILSGFMVISLGSLAGIPPLGGFIAKLLILYYAFSFELYALVCVALIGVVISMYYYFGWIREVFEKVVKGTLKLSVTNNILLILLVFSVVLILSGLYPALFFYFLN